MDINANNIHRLLLITIKINKLQIQCKNILKQFKDNYRINNQYNLN